MMSKKILITGASGLVGSHLTDMLQQQGYQVVHVGRTKRAGKISTFVWDVNAGTFDVQALAGVDTIINLAGAGIADKRWSTSRKREILESRTKSVALLNKVLSTTSHQVTTFVSASAIGYYGFGFGDEVFTEDTKPGTDFLANVTKQWEEEMDKIQQLSIRVVKLRIGIVLSDKGGALTEMAKPVRMFAGSPLGSGKQNLSWIHIEDLGAMFLKAATDETLRGAYSAVSGNWVSNKEITKAIGKVLNRPVWPVHVPAFVLKLMLGEMANIVLQGSKVTADKIKQTGFEFKYTTLEAALKSLRL
ncbi:MAG: TIGR01777 family oxidoreductase [Cyclobacteriaceae bacterium]|nr:TIGR01777 family oxidoreductase [Cyclobacteriaceae bacterium]